MIIIVDSWSPDNFGKKVTAGSRIKFNSDKIKNFIVHKKTYC